MFCVCITCRSMWYWNLLFIVLRNLNSTASTVQRASVIVWHTWQSRHLQWSLILQVMPHWAATARYSSLLDLWRISGLFATVPFLLRSSASSSGVWHVDSACAAASLVCIKQHINSYGIYLELNIHIRALRNWVWYLNQLVTRVLQERFVPGFQQERRTWTRNQWNWAKQTTFSIVRTNLSAWFIRLLLEAKDIRLQQCNLRQCKWGNGSYIRICGQIL